MKQRILAGFLLLLSACDNGKKEAASPQSAPYTIVSKYCSEGKFEVTTKTPVLSTLDYTAKIGEAVTITGTVTKGSPCLGGSGFRFQCEGTYNIAEKRNFSCKPGSGTVSALNPQAIAGKTVSFAGAPAAFALQQPHNISGAYSNYQSIPLRGGSVNTYSNGTKYAVEIQFQNPLLPQGFGMGVCSGGWTCP